MWGRVRESQRAHRQSVHIPLWVGMSYLELTQPACVWWVVLQGLSKEEPCRAFALRSWQWSIKNKVKSCGSLLAHPSSKLNQRKLHGQMVGTDG